MGKKNRSKRKKSSESSDVEKSNSRSKSAKYGEEPSGSTLLMDDTIATCSISEVLQNVNSVLYDQSAEQLHSEVFQSPLSEDNKQAKESKTLTMASEEENVQATTMPPSNPSNADIMKYLQKIDHTLSNVNKRLETLDIVEKKVNEFDKELKNLWIHIKDNNDKLDTKIQKVETAVDDHAFAIGNAADKIESLESANAALKDEMVYIQSQSMRNNLVFSGIEEDKNETPELTERKLRDFLVDKLHMAQEAVKQLHFDRVHRFGSRSNTMIYRRIVAKFTFYKQREVVRKLRKNLEHTDYYISEQFPKEISDRRRTLVPKLLKARSEGKEAWISYDKLYVAGKQVKDSQSEEAAESMQTDSQGASAEPNQA